MIVCIMMTAEKPWDEGEPDYNDEYAEYMESQQGNPRVAQSALVLAQMRSYSPTGRELAHITVEQESVVVLNYI